MAEINTLCRLFLNTCRAYRKPDLLMVKEDGRYRPISTAEFEAAVRSLALGFQELGLRPGDKVALISENRPEWTITDFAVLTSGAVTVPIYTSLTPEQVRYIIHDSGAKMAVCSSRELLEKIESVRSELPELQHVFLMEKDAPAGVPALAETIETGKDRDRATPDVFESRALAVKPEDLASIIYTSGTTGVPKGVMLSHANFMSNIMGVEAIIQFRDTDTALSFLPLSHVLERMATFLFLFKGATIAYAESVESVAVNLLEVRPTVVVSVPRLFEKIYSRIMDQVLSGSRVKQALFFWALDAGKKWAAAVVEKKPVGKGLAFRQALAHKLVFSKITAKTGGRINQFICGGAALSPDIAEFFYAAGLVILPGYGLTETSPVLTGSTVDSYRFGTAGRALPNVELKIAEDGEILARGPNIMMGYYKAEAETREVMIDGWFHTGDIGRLDDDGFLTITDRKKDIIVTSGGKNVAPQPIESFIQTSPYIQNAVVIGDGRKFISALIVPEFEKIEAYAQANNISFGGRTELCGKKEIADLLLDEVNRTTQHLAPYEKVKKIAVLDRDFEIGTGEITPTLKVKRNAVERKYADLIESLYRD
ncbi:MAG: long-chain fatty acid--CoA ligase [Acidobacteriota bacterium]|nr:long-chain fatty acid--CoA ligase [Acidobacteriota bacterium]